MNWLNKPACPSELSVGFQEEFDSLMASKAEEVEA
jgi:hypothetical protein